MGAVKVLSAGFNVTLQDLGRPQHQHLGVPVSGALDPVAFRLANALVGNPGETVALELRLMGPTLEVMADSARVALAGTRAQLELLDGDGVQLPSHCSVRVTRGQRLRISSIADSGVAYLAIEGGIEVPELYGSRSTYVRASLGGFGGRALQEGDELPLGLTEAEPRGEIRHDDLSYLDQSGPMRIVFGPQDDYFTSAAIDLFLGSDYLVSREADRMGIRLDGPELEHARGYNIVSDGIVTGAVQVPGTGLPIVLLADHQTTGGYPKIGTVISADIPRLGRLRPGDSLRFERISVQQAEGLRRELEGQIMRMIEKFRPADGWLDETALYSQNLVSGVIAGSEDAG